VCRRDGLVQLVVGQRKEGLERCPCLTLFVEELQGVQVHGSLDRHRLAVFAEYLAEHAALLAERCVGRGTADEMGHQVGVG